MIEPTLVITLLDRSYTVLKQQADGLTHEDSLLQMPFRANCMNWVLGHILSSRSGFMIALGLTPIWTDEQRAIYLRGSDAITEANCDKAARLEDMLRDLDRSQEQIVACLQTKTFEDMKLPSDRPNMSMGERLGHSVWHEAYHTGNTEALRQLAGMDDQVIK
jgi:uncharacterized damage-inducible protein DinB